MKGFAGGVVTDEPRAALIARDVLSANGTAVDAAVALYFALAVTLPSSAGLGGGGVCVVHDPEEKRTEAIDFMPRAAPGGLVALPGNARGMAALHARYGRLKWAQLLAPAEEMARFGTPASRALAREIATAGDALLADSDTAQVFTHDDGRFIDEGESLRQPELGNVLGQLRQGGAGELYTGTLARNLAEASEAIGLPLGMDTLRGTLPQFRETVEVPFGNQTVHFAPVPGGIVAAQMVAMLTMARSYDDAGADEQPHLIVEASKRAFADRARWLQPDGTSRDAPAGLATEDYVDRLMANYDAGRATPVSAFSPRPVGWPENPWATSFVVADRDGFAVACNVTMNELFGTARMVPGTGILLAPAPDRRGHGGDSLGPMIMSNKPTGGFYYAAAASGGPTAATALVAVFLRAVDGEQNLEAALDARRLHHNGDPDLVYFEQGESAATLDSLKRRGHQTEVTGIIGRVNAIWCPTALPRGAETCRARADGRANGLASMLTE